ncbi:DNA topoisomerase-1 [Flavobacterium gossypii]|uniref:DNA topoisomerase n=1 Tax=Flavobacterium gossypii TaxID=1646119 RepID=A0ABR6DTZ8_9FLAO|nr:DNA topoisomerase IB [Flavobacterium gossypii]MBA9075148.1 DNA topoisomerase-1 [Flavobacterium gossypii]
MNRLEAKLQKIGSDPKITAKAVGLRYSSPTHKGYYREKDKNSAFIYKDENNKTVKDKLTIERIKKLVIPPAWEEVWISPYENGHLQVTGIDAKGRKQYRYHPNWNKIRNQSKFYRLRRFANALPIIRKQIDKDLERKGLPYEKVVALVVKLIEMTNIRIGNDAYKKLYGSFGLTTLRDKHVKFSNSTIYFDFKGKKGVTHKISLQSRKMANLVKKCKEIPGQELFQYYDDDGKHHSIGSADINNYLKEITQEDFTAKDFRVWAGSVNALFAFQQIGRFETETECKRNIVAVVDCVAKKLGNTRTVCRKYYVHPTVIASYEKGSIWNYKLKKNIKNNKLNPEEEALVRLLKKETIAEVLG